MSDQNVGASASTDKGAARPGADAGRYGPIWEIARPPAWVRLINAPGDCSGGSRSAGRGSTPRP